LNTLQPQLNHTGMCLTVACYHL